MRPAFWALVLLLAVTVVAIRAQAWTSKDLGIEKPAPAAAKRCPFGTRWSPQWKKCVRSVLPIEA